MHRVEEIPASCPFCGEPITLLIDGSVPVQEYVEDCEVCCRPMVISYKVTGQDEIMLEVKQEDA